jgi:hypothetical protein
MPQAERDIAYQIISEPVSEHVFIVLNGQRLP